MNKFKLKTIPKDTEPKKHTEYTITLKNGKTIKFWFIGTQIEKVLKDYEIPFTKKEVR